MKSFSTWPGSYWPCLCKLVIFHFPKSLILKFQIQKIKLFFLGALSFKPDIGFLLAAKSILNQKIAPALVLHQVKQTPDIEEFEFKILGINQKLQYLNFDNSKKAILLILLLMTWQSCIFLVFMVKFFN